MARPTATRRSSRTLTASTSAARRTTTSPLASGITSAWAPTWPAWRSRSCSRSCCAACRTSSWPGRSSACARPSSTASSGCRCAPHPRGADFLRTRVCARLGIELPLFAFSHCRDVVAAVSRAGGLGVLGALAFSNEQLHLELRWLDEHVGGKPYGVDVVMPASLADQPAFDKAAFEAMIPERHRAFVEEVLERYRVPTLPAGEVPHEGLLAWTHAGARSQVEIALAHPIKLLVNALGTPPRDVIDQVHARGVQVAALCGSVEHARRHVEAGVDIILAPGSEGGGPPRGDRAPGPLPPRREAGPPPPPPPAGGGRRRAPD